MEVKQLFQADSEMQICCLVLFWGDGGFNTKANMVENDQVVTTDVVSF